MYDAAEETDSGDDPQVVEDLRDSPFIYELICHYQPKISGPRQPRAQRRGPRALAASRPRTAATRPVSARRRKGRPHAAGRRPSARSRPGSDPVLARSGLALTVAVNLSTTNLLDVGLVDTIDRLLRTHQLPPDALILELTESTLATDSRAPATRSPRCGDSESASRSTTDGTGWSSLAACRISPSMNSSSTRSLSHVGPRSAVHRHRVLHGGTCAQPWSRPRRRGR